MQLKRKKRFEHCKEKVLRLIKSVKGGLQFLGTTDILVKYFLLCGCLMHCKVLSNSPGLYPVEANSKR